MAKSAHNLWYGTTSRSDISGGAAWTYDANRPHAVTAAGTNTYTYDGNGNMLTRNGSSVWWLPFNKPRAIFSDTNSYTFYYDTNRNRVLETVIEDGTMRSLVKVGSLYEEVYNDGVKSYRLSIPTPAGFIGVWSVGDLGESRTYNHNDMLGSVGIITNESGTVQQEYAYDPWGAPRNASNWTALSVWPDYKNDRGYTGHKMLEGLELVHMNGRIYDPAIGRFLTADPFIQFSGNSQSYNRYAYTLNNPLRYTDPSGHFVFSLTVGALLAANGGVNLGVYVTCMVWAGMADAMMAGASGEDILKAGAISGAQAFIGAKVAGGIGGIFKGTAWGGGQITLKATMHELARALAHGVSQGAISELTGGDFGSGFYGGAFGSFAGHAADAAGLDGFSGFAVATLVGGTSAEIGGGKFANGAISAAVTHLFNQMGEKNEAQSEETERYTVLLAEDLANMHPTIDGEVSELTYLEHVQNAASELNLAAQEAGVNLKFTVDTFSSPQELKALLVQYDGTTISGFVGVHGDPNITQNLVRYPNGQIMTSVDHKRLVYGSSNRFFTTHCNPRDGELNPNQWIEPKIKAMWNEIHQ